MTLLLLKVTLYAAVGSQLTQYDVDVANATLTKRASIMLPANVQEAAPSPSKKYFYVAWSNGGPSNLPAGSAPATGNQHGLSAFRVDPNSGALIPHGPSVSLPSRPIHVTTDVSGTHVLTAYNDPSGITVHQILSGGSLGTEIKPNGALDAGVYGHQVRVDPSNEVVILVTRGNGPTATKPEDPGALKIFDYKDGKLTNRISIAPGGGFNFQSRHLDFHPTQPWIFLSLERQNKLTVFQKLKDSTPGIPPSFTKDTLAEPKNVRPGQALGTVHVHPNGRFVYLANRASSTAGENSIAVFAINQKTGEPTLIQNADTHGIHTRTFALDSSGRILVAANMMQVGSTPANLAVFRIKDDGKLEFVRKYDIDVSGKNIFWMGMI